MTTGAMPPPQPGQGTLLRAVLADDAPLIRGAIAGLLRAEGIAVVAEAGDGQGLEAAVRTTRPDVAVVDLRMPPTHSLEGLEAAVTIRRRYPSVGILLLSQHCTSRFLATLLAQGASGVGYLLKERVSGPEVFVDAVRRVATGGCAVDPELVQLMLRDRARQLRLDGLTGRERQVLELMAEGRSNAAISQQLDVSAKTVETHIRGIFTTLDLPPQEDDHRRVLAVLTYLQSRA